MNRRLTLFLFLLLSACAPAPSFVALPEVAATQLVIVPEPTATSIPPLPAATLIPCDPAVEDFCIVEGNFIFQNPLGPDSVPAIARSYPYGSTDNGRRDPHHGVDLESEEGAPVFASAAGAVIFAGPDRDTRFATWKDYYGNVVVIRHDNGLYTLYGHLSRIDVAVGNRVSGGDVIATVGHTGVAIGGHLHFEVRKDGDGTDYFSTENPELWLVLQDGFGALSITLDSKISHKIQRKLSIWRYFAGTDTPQESYYAFTYPKGFEQNKEDFVLSNLPPGRYRIAFTDSTGLYDRWVNVEAGKLTQVVFVVE
ncbi:MAG: M23 family metallopeptidase [Anaerolineales bacterium]|nr:M23 family metallopeptidase [Anaerolineales bacterium]